jgi:hypothetical protein
LSIVPSETLLATSAIKASCRICPKQSETSASSTHVAPLLTSALTTSRAWMAERFGRKPKLTERKSASKTGSRTIRAAAITTRSATQGTVASYFASCQGMLGFGLDFVGEVD